MRQDKRRLAASQSINAEAYEDYLKGRYYWGQRSEAALTTAIQYFSDATAKDPQYALAYAGLADGYGIVGSAIVGTVPTSISRSNWQPGWHLPTRIGRGKREGTGRQGNPVRSDRRALR